MKRRQLTTRTVLRSTFLLLACLLLGLVLGAFLVPLAGLLRAQAETYYPQLDPSVVQGIQAAEPQLSQSLVGLVLFGLAAFLLLSLALNGYAASLLSELVARLREKDLLPYSFEAKKKRKGLLSNQKGVIELFESYVDQLHGAHTEKKRYQDALNTYADPTVAQRLSTAQHGSQNIRPERRSVAILFSDIRGFTAMSEILLPEQVVELLNDYFSFATEAVNKNGGKVNKFIGDAVMAVFEVPAYSEASAPKAAIMAALEMQEEFQRHLPTWKTRIPQRFDCNLGVGVHYGDAILGTLGSDERREYTAIGDTVNFASRLCSLAKAGQVRVSDDCFERVQDSFDGQAQEAVPVKGKTGTHVTYVVSRKRLLGR
jgi:class 3 adenylate cyclase